MVGYNLMKKTMRLKILIILFIYLRLITFSSELNQLINNFSFEDSDLTFPVISLADASLDQNTSPIRSFRIMTPNPSIIKDFLGGFIANGLKSTIFLNYAIQNIFHTPFTSYKFVINKYTADSWSISPFPEMGEKN